MSNKLSTEVWGRQHCLIIDFFFFFLLIFKLKFWNYQNYGTATHAYFLEINTYEIIATNNYKLELLKILLNWQMFPSYKKIRLCVCVCVLRYYADVCARCSTNVYTISIFSITDVKKLQYLRPKVHIVYAHKLGCQVIQSSIYLKGVLIYKSKF